MSNYLPLAVRKILTQTGWSGNELAIYSALLSEGPLPLTTLAEETSIGVSTVQYVLKQLILKRLVKKTTVNGKPRYSAASLDALQKWMKGYLKQFFAFEDTINRFIEQYDFHPQILLSRVRFFEGYRGVKQSYRTLLAECQGREIVGFFSVVEDVGQELQDFFVEEYIPRRVDKGIHMRNITLESPRTIAYQRHDDEQLRQTRLIARDSFPALNTEINLYDDCLHAMSFTTDSAFAIIIQDAAVVAMLRAIFDLLWRDRHDVYMTDAPAALEETRTSRRHLYPADFRRRYVTARPEIEQTRDGESVLRVMGHEVMSTYQIPYMDTLAEIVTRQGGDILNIGYGLGLVDRAIERYRQERKLGKHVVVEINEHIAALARENTHLSVIEADWRQAIDAFRGVQFDGICYDGYPLSLSEVHRDGVPFIERVVERNLLREDGILTFFVDAAEHLGKDFIAFLEKLGFGHIEVMKVPIRVPDRQRQIWQADHFLAPIVQYRARARSGASTNRDS